MSSTESQAEPPDLTVVNIVAVSYSGSTWLNLVLGSHPQAFSVGEMDRLRKWGCAFCRVHGDGCDVWSRYRIDGPVNPFVQLHELTGKKLFIVNNTRQFLADQKHPRIKSRYLFLVRDGRAVVASAIRKMPGRTVWRASRHWVRTLKRKRRCIRRLPAEDTMMLHYEKLLTDGPGELKRLSDFLGIDCQLEILEFWRHQHCFIAGNVGPLVMVAQHHGIELPPLPPGLPGVRLPAQNGPDPYSQSEPRNFLDERWKDELTDRQLRIFGLAAGRLNQQLGYPPSTQR